ncbi:MAG: hypothetical protein QM753_11195 [Thermomicrobiales bacterium]
MRRTALLGLAVVLSGCQNYVSSPFDGFGGFISDTHGFQSDPNRPSGNTPNMLRASGQEVDIEPLTVESGNVWPGPAQEGPTLQDLQREQNRNEFSNAPRLQPRGSSVPPGSVAPAPATPAPQPASAPQLPPQTPPSTQFYQSPGGPVASPQPGNNVRTYTDPRGGTGIIVPNANGTSTMIAPDGTVTTVPTPR